MEPANKAASVLVGLGISILLTNAMLIYLNDLPWEVIYFWYPWISNEVPVTEITGPLSIDQLGFLQIQLENRALLDNLAISPIGDLW